jgi:5-(carboxyamino)imidazole ribonucleotide mutase
VPLKHLEGLDSLMSIVQMPAGIPVATVAIGGAKNAGILAARILGIGDAALRERLVAYERSLADLAREKGQVVRDATRGSASS